MKKITIIGTLALVCSVHSARAQDTPTRATTRVAIATRDLTRGNVLTETDMKWTDTTGVASPSDTARITAGWIVRRSIRAGEILREPGVSRPDMVSNGDAVDVIYSAPGISIKVRGTAIGSGAQGEQVYVRLDNRKRLRGVVAGVNTVRVM